MTRPTQRRVRASGAAAVHDVHAGHTVDRAYEKPHKSVHNRVIPLAEVSSSPSESPDADSGRVWRLWFAARMGPPRTVYAVVAGQRVKTKRRRLELPPTQNDRLHFRVKAPWVAEWRSAGVQAAWAHRMPALGRVRISAVVHRRAVGKADASNDMERLKPLVDGLVDAQVIPDDRRRFVEYGAITEERYGPGGPGVLLIVEALEV